LAQNLSVPVDGSRPGQQLEPLYLLVEVVLLRRGDEKQPPRSFIAEVANGKNATTISSRVFRPCSNVLSSVGA